MTSRNAQGLFAMTAGLLFLLSFAVRQNLLIAVIFGGVLVLASVLFIRAFEDRQRPIGWEAIFFVAVTVRWAMATGIQSLVYENSPGLFAPDETFYDWLGQYLAEYWSGRVPPLVDVRIPGIAWLMGGCYFVFGKGLLLPKFINAIGGAWTAILTGLIALRLFNPLVARRAAWLAALWPSLVLWGSLGTKDNGALLGVLLISFAAIRLREQIRPTMFVPLALGLGLVLSNRSYQVVFLAAGMAFGLLFSSSRSFLRNLVVGGLIVAAFAVLIRKTDATEVFGSDESAIERISDLRTGYAINTGSAVNVDIVDVSTPTGAVVWAPIGLAYFFFAPIPFTGTSAISIATSPEMLAFYLLVPGMMRGLRLLFRFRRALLAAPVLFYVLIASVGWSLAIGNVGSLYRYRAQVFFFPLILIAADMVYRRELARRAELERARRIVAAPGPSLARPAVPARGLPVPSVNLSSPET